MYEFDNELNNLFSSQHNLAREYSFALIEIRAELFKLEQRVKDLEEKINEREEDHS